MAVKRNRWLIGGVLFIAVAALLAVSFLPFLSGALTRTATQSNPASTPGVSAEDQRAELEGRANGYQLVLEREPDNQTALKGLVEARITLGDLKGVVEPLEKLVELNPNTPNYAVLLGQTKQRLGDLEGAAQVYRRVLTASPGNMEALQGLVVLLLDQQRPQAAVGLLQDTLKTANQSNEIQPGSIDVISVKLLLGQVYVEQKRYSDAIATYDEAIKDAEAQNQTTPDFRPLLAKALVLKEMGKPEEAQPLFDQAMAMAPVQYKDGIQKLAAPATPATPSPTPETATPPATPSPTPGVSNNNPEAGSPETGTPAPANPN